MAAEVRQQQLEVRQRCGGNNLRCDEGVARQGDDDGEGVVDGGGTGDEENGEQSRDRRIWWVNK